MELTADEIEKKYADEIAFAESHAAMAIHRAFNEQDSHAQYAGVELAEYLVWLGSNADNVSAPRLAILAVAAIKTGMWWSEIAEDLGLPVPPEWE